MQQIIGLLLKHAVEQTQLAWKQYPQQFREQFHYQKMDGLIMNKQGFVLFGRPGARNFGETIDYDTMQADFSKAYILLGYSLATIVPIEIWRADPTGTFLKVIPTQSGALANSHNILREYLAAEYDRDITFAAEGNNTPTTNDGRPVISTAHPRNRLNTAETWSNKLSVGADLGVLSAQQIFLMLLRQKDPKGFGLINDRAVTLMGSTDLYFVAREILRSEMQPYTADHTENVLKGENIKIALNPYWLAQTAAGLAAGVYNSYLFAGEGHTRRFYYGQEEPELENQYHLPTRSTLYVATTNSAVGTDSPYHVAGSPGA